MSSEFYGFPLAGWLSRFTKIQSADGPDNIYADCPFCGGKNTLAASKIKNIFRCFRCHEGGHAREVWNGTCGLLKMVTLLEHCSYAQAKEKIAALGGMNLAQQKVADERPKRPQNIWPDGAIPLLRCSPTNPGVKMLRRRGVEHLLHHSYFMVDGRYSDRVLLPCFWQGMIQGFEAKASFPTQQPKTLYPTWFRTGESLYTTFNWDYHKNFAVITESILDAETLGCNAIGLYGSNLKDYQFDLLLELRHKGVSNLVWMLDADALKKAVRMILTKANAFFSNYFAKLPMGEDPNSVGRDAAWTAVSAAKQISNEEDVLPLLLEGNVF